MTAEPLTGRAWAKVNLTLDVLGLRPDGYHDLRSVMQTVSLCDDVAVLPDAGEWRVCCADPAVPAGEDNLALRAARAYVRAADVRTDGVTVTLEKRIPMQAGLGGGSADAAAVLRALNRRYQALSEEELCALAGEIGSDVPFCVRGGTMLCEGRGERMTPLPPLAPCWFVICKPEFSVPTAALFRALDAHPELCAGGAAAAEAAVRQGELPRGVRTNRFERLLEREHPELAALRGALLDAGALLASLTGTGSACFGLFASKSDAKRAYDALLTAYPRTFLAQPV